jgi:hypothetical protein
MKLTKRWVRNAVSTTERREAQRTVIGSLLEDGEKKINIKLICILSSFFIVGVHKFSNA